MNKCNHEQVFKAVARLDAKLATTTVKDNGPNKVAHPIRQVVIGYGLTPVKSFMRLWLQKFVPGVSPQPLVRVLTTV